MLIPAFNKLFWTVAKNPLTWVILILAGLALVLEDLYGWANGNKSAFGGLWEMLFDGPQDAKQSFETFFNTAKFVFEYLKNAPKRIVENFKSSFRQLEYSFKSLNLVQRFNDVLRDIQNASNTELSVTIGNTKSPIDELCQWINEQFTAVGRFIDGVFADVQNTASSVTSAIEGFFNNLGANIKSAIGDAIDWALGKLASLATAIRNTPIVGGAVGSAIDYFSGGSTNNSNSSYSSSTSVGEINVYTQATDASGIAGDIGGAVSNRFNYGFANGGVY
jgi:hypothetical protein